MFIHESPMTETYIKNGVWGHRTLDNLIKQSALRSPQAPALSGKSYSIDTDNLHHKNFPLPTLTYEELEKRIETLASFFQSLGLKTDAIVGVRIDNSLENVICLLAIWRAGMIACPIPMTWRQPDIITLLSQVGAKALIGSIGDDETKNTDLLRETAVEVFGIRFVFATGAEIPEGIIDLKSILNLEEQFPNINPITRKGNPANHIATLTWITGVDNGPTPIPRSHNHWIATGMMTMLESYMHTGSKLHSTYLLSGISGIGASMVPWLLTSGHLILEHFETVNKTLESIKSWQPNTVLLPGSLLKAYSQTCATLPKPPTLLAIWPDRQQNSQEKNVEEYHDIIDIQLFNEFAFIPKKRLNSDNIFSIKLGDINCPSTIEKAPFFMQIKLHNSKENPLDPSHKGVIAIKGSIIPEAPWPKNTFNKVETSLYWDMDGFLTTTQLGQKHATLPNHLSLHSVTDDYKIQVGSLAIVAHVVDDIYKSYSRAADAAVFTHEDNAIGNQLVAAIVPKDNAEFSHRDFFNYLNNAKVATHIIPTTVITTSIIPKDEDNQVLRHELTKLAAL